MMQCRYFDGVVGVAMMAAVVMGACNTVTFDAFTRLETDTDTDTGDGPGGPSDTGAGGEDTGSLSGGPFLVPEEISTCSTYRPQMGIVGSLSVFVVGDGTPVSCTEIALQTASALVAREGRGMIRFDCGRHPVTISMLRPLVIPQGVELYLDGGGLVTLDGRNVSRIVIVAPDVQLQIRGVRFVRGLASGALNGGAILFENGGASGALVLSGCVFEDNLSESGRGGALFAEDLNSILIHRTRFEYNRAAFGGAVFVFGKRLVLTDSEFLANEVFREGGAVNFDAYSYVDGTESFAVCGCRFYRNRSVYHGAAVKAYLYEDNVTRYARTEFIENETTANGTMGNGHGALYHHGSPVEVMNTSFVRNVSRTSAAGLYLNARGESSLINCTFSQNRAMGEEGYGGGMFLADSEPSVCLNCTFFENRARFGAAVYRAAPGLWLNNSIFQDNTISDDDLRPATCHRTHEGRHNLQWVASADAADQLPCTEDTVFDNPRIAAARDNGGSVATCALAPDSAAVRDGAECPLVDARDYPRKVHCDLGAYEVQAAP